MHDLNYIHARIDAYAQASMDAMDKHALKLAAHIQTVGLEMINLIKGASDERMAAMHGLENEILERIPEAIASYWKRNV